MFIKIVTILKLNYVALYIVNYSRLFILIGFKSTLNTTYPLFAMEKYNIPLCSRFQLRLKFEIELAEICH